MRVIVASNPQGTGRYRGPRRRGRAWTRGGGVGARIGSHTGSVREDAVGIPVDPASIFLVLAIRICRCRLVVRDSGDRPPHG